jgi:tRNA threonylcarbamoyladenosine biosynthesis protein TsaE
MTVESLKTIVVSELDQLESAASELLNFMGDGKVVAVFGPMGAGKTTFIKTVCKVLEVEDNVSSPTFSIVNEYKAKSGEIIYHFDFYRIKDESEAYDMGFEDYLYSGNKCFIEWPEKIPGLLPLDCITVNITENPDQSRVFTLQK